MAGTTEYVVKGGTHLYPLCGDVFKANGIKVSVIGYAHSVNYAQSYDSLHEHARKLGLLVGDHKHPHKLRTSRIPW